MSNEPKKPVRPAIIRNEGVGNSFILRDNTIKGDLDVIANSGHVENGLLEGNNIDLQPTAPADIEMLRVAGEVAQQLPEKDRLAFLGAVARVGSGDEAKKSLGIAYLRDLAAKVGIQAVVAFIKHYLSL